MLKVAPKAHQRFCALSLHYRGAFAGLRLRKLLALYSGADAQGAQILRDKVVLLVEGVYESSTPFDEWLSIVDELLLLIEADQSGTVANTPKLSPAGLGIGELKRVAARLSSSTAFELSLVRPATKPTFSYRAPDGYYIPFNDASPGQQANALLSLLFGHAVGPLLIEQPEDDLDRATALSIAESIWSAKEKRQLGRCVTQSKSLGDRRRGACTALLSLHASSGRSARRSLPSRAE